MADPPSAAAWIEEARADLDVAALLTEHGRPAYAAFFAHLALEKALKGLYWKQQGAPPPVTHNLLYLAERAELTVPEDLRAFLAEINRASLLNLYPDRLRFSGVLDDAPPELDAAEVRSYLDRSRALMDWITDHLPPA